MKKILLLTFMALFFAAPAGIFHLSVGNTIRQLSQEHEKQKFRILQDRLKAADQLSNPLAELYRDLFLLLRNLTSFDPDWVSKNDISNAMLDYLKKEIAGFKNYDGVKTSFSIAYAQNGKDEYLTFPDDNSGFWVQQLTSCLKRLKLHYDSREKFRSISDLQETQRLKEILVNHVGGFLNLLLLSSDGDGQRSQRSVIRTDKELTLLVFQRLTNTLLMNFSFDLSRYTVLRQLKRKIGEFKNSDTGIIIKLRHPFSKTLTNDYFDKHNGLLAKVEKLIKNRTEHSFNTVIENYLIVAASDDPKKPFRVILVEKIPEVAQNRPMQLLISLLAVIGCFCFKVACESIVMSRHLNISVTLFIVAIFSAVSVIPMLSAVFLSGEYIVSNFKISRTQVFDNLENELKSLDHQTFANLKDTINTLKEFDSLESIASFTGLPAATSSDRLFEEMLNRLRKIRKSNFCSELWIYEEKKEVFGFKFSHDLQRYIRDKSQNQILLQFFLPKFKEFMKSGIDLKPSIKDQEIEVESLKTEMFDSFILNLFGDKTYYSVRESFDHLMKFESLFETNIVLNLPVNSNNERKFILTWVFSLVDLRKMFPFEKLKIDVAEPTFSIFGNDRYMGGQPGNIRKLTDSHPDLMKIARQAHLTNSRIVTQDTSAPESPVYEALPARHSNLIIAGKRLPPTLSSIISGLISNALRIFVIAIGSGLLIALFTSLYFTLPIRRLTDATQEIINENYSVRLETSHPDEFATAATAFNKMAAGLEEGRLLSRFVSKSVKEIAEQGSAALQDARSAEVTVLFSSIKDFHQLRRHLEPEKIFEILQAHLSAAVESISVHGGEIDKMIEDKVMIVFSKETGSSNPESAAVQTAFHIRTLLKSAFDLSVAAGINSGEVISGVMGATNVRLSKTVVGDTVNLAARLAYVAGELAEGGIVAEKHTAELVSADFKAQKLGINQVKGKTHAVEAYLISK